MKSRQKGAVLIVCLVILLVMTLLGVSNMQSSNMQLKMASNNQARQKAFEAAEATLRFAEVELQNNGHEITDFQGVAGCANGYCFSGTYAANTTAPQCDVGTAAPVWEDQTSWYNSSAAYTETDLPDARYVIEFMCYGKKDFSASCDVIDDTGCVALFRVTSLAISEGASARVMLQSMVRVIYQ